MLSRKTNPKVDWLKVLKIWKCTLSTHDKSILANKANSYAQTMLLNLVRLQSVFSFFTKQVPMYVHTSYISAYFLFKACSIFWNMKKSVNMQYYACPLAWSSQLWNCMVMQMICHKSAIRESMAGSVIQATGKVEFENGLRSGVLQEDCWCLSSGCATLGSDMASP